jgi:uncharacterized protein YbjT (DUF2867 family)
MSSKVIAVFGAHGKIGQRLIAKLAQSREFKALAFYRNIEQKTTFDKLGVESRLLTLEAPVDEIAHNIKGAYAVVFSAGAGGTGLDKTFSIDLDGAVKTMEAAEQAGVRRYVMVSAFGAQNRDVWYNGPIRSYYIAKKYADRILATTQLEYTILEPARLLDGDGTGKIADPATAYSAASAERAIHREDVASFIVEALEDSRGTSYRKTIPLINGAIPIQGFLHK